jgi:hypothetical protein
VTGPYFFSETQKHILIANKIIATQRIEAHHCKKQIEEFVFASIRNGARLILVWLLLYYQFTYVIADMNCNRPVYSDVLRNHTLPQLEMQTTSSNNIRSYLRYYNI